MYALYHTYVRTYVHTKHPFFTHTMDATTSNNTSSYTHVNLYVIWRVHLAGISIPMSFLWSWLILTSGQLNNLLSRGSKTLDIKGGMNVLSLLECILWQSRFKIWRNGGHSALFIAYLIVKLLYLTLTSQ